MTCTKSSARIIGEDLQFVEVELDPNEATVAEAGSMMFMEDGIEMETVFGDGSQKQTGFMGALMGAGRAPSPVSRGVPESQLPEAPGRLRRAVSGPDRGAPSLRARRRTDRAEGFVPRGREGRRIGIAFQEDRRGPLRRRGFIMQRLQGDGWAFVHAGGMLQERTLAPNELIRVDTGCIVALQPSVSYDIEFVGKIKTALFGGEGLFFATLRGPGRVWLQSLPLSRLANRIVSAVPGIARGGKEEGSLLRGLGGLWMGTIVDRVIG